MSFECDFSVKKYCALKTYKAWNHLEVYSETQQSAYSDERQFFNLSESLIPCVKEGKEAYLTGLGVIRIRQQTSSPGQGLTAGR